jgi:hypothetical protein
MDRVMEKMSKLNATNQSMNNSVLNQSTAAPAPPQLPRPARTTALSTIAPASPSVAPQSLNFNFSSPVRPVGMTPLQASSLAMNRVQQFAMASQSAATISQEAIVKIFQNTPAKEKEDIMKVAEIVKNKYNAELLSVAHGGPRFNKFVMRFINEYAGIKQNAQAEAKLGYEYYKLLP